MEDINRLKIVLVEKKRTGKWLAELTFFGTPEDKIIQ